MRFTCGLTLDCFQQMASYMTFMNVVRYYPIAFLAFIVFWVIGRQYFQSSRVQEAFPKDGRIKYELLLSFSTLLIFVLVGMGSVVLGQLGFNKVYFKADVYGWWYLPVSFGLVTVFHETYFYWAHRLMHSKVLFKYVHLSHHKSVNPSPFAGYSFHPLEAILEGIYLPLFVLVVPMHFNVLIIHTFYAMILNIWFHTGYEFLPSGFTKGRLTKWINTSTHHNMHHSHTNGNYSLYFNFWDRIMGTNFKEYDQRFEAVKARGKAARSADADASDPATA